MNTDAKALSLALTAPFPADAVHWKPLSVKDNRALAAAYLDARAIMQRLDCVFGVGGWQDSYQLQGGGSVVCTLSVKVDGEWVVKTDVGSPSEQPDDGDKLKAAFSDALKRAAVKLGIGRYLYRLPPNGWTTIRSDGSSPVRPSCRRGHCPQPSKAPEPTTTASGGNEPLRSLRRNPPCHARPSTPSVSPCSTGERSCLLSANGTTRA